VDVDAERTLTRDQLRTRMRLIAGLPVGESDPSDAFHLVANSLVQATDSAEGMVGEIHLDRHGDPLLRDYADVGPAKTADDRVLSSVDLTELLRRILRDRAPVTVPDSYGEVLVQGWPGPAEVVPRILALPLVLGNRVVGVIVLAGRRHGYPESLIDHLQGVVEPIAAMVVSRSADINRQRRADLTANILHSIGAAVIAVDAAGTIRFTNRHTDDLLGYPEGSLVGRSVDELVPSSFRVGHASHRSSFAGDPSPHIMAADRDVRAIRADGSEVPVQIRLSSLASPGEAPEYFVATMVDITERIRLRTELSTALESRTLVMEGANLASWDWNVTTGRVDFNDRWAAQLGWDPSDIKPEYREWESRLHPEDRDETLRRLDYHLRGRTDWYSAEYRLKHRTGRWVWVMDRGRVMRYSEDGKPLRVSGMYWDITDRKHAEAERERLIRELERTQKALSELARIDELTGLGNRRVLTEALRIAWEEAVSRQHSMAVLMLDLDRFKEYNDRLGHLAGDEALKRVAQALLNNTRARETVTRHGGEEFVVVMPDIAASDAIAAAERIRAAVAASTPDPQLALTVSVGAATFVGHPSTKPEGLLHEADHALYEAKRGGRNRVVARAV